MILLPLYYVANAHWYKTVKVGSLYPYRAGKSIYGKIVVGDSGEAYFKGNTSKNYDFDDNQLLMQTGITNYINMN